MPFGGSQIMPFGGSQIWICFVNYNVAMLYALPNMLDEGWRKKTRGAAGVLLTPGPSIVRT